MNLLQNVLPYSTSWVLLPLYNRGKENKQEDRTKPCNRPTPNIFGGQLLDYLLVSDSPPERNDHGLVRDLRNDISAFGETPNVISQQLAMLLPNLVHVIFDPLSGVGSLEVSDELVA